MLYKIDIVSYSALNKVWNWCFDDSEIRCDTTGEFWDPASEKEIAEKQFNEIDEDTLFELGTGEYKIELTEMDLDCRTELPLDEKTVIVT